MALASIKTFVAIFLCSFTTSQDTRQIKPLIAHEFRIDRDAYSLLYDGQHRQARWVYEYLTLDQLKGEANRSRCDFIEDPSIPRILRSTKMDYQGAGYDRGHLCPAQDAKFSERAMQETFFLSNTSPQYPQLNRGIWVKLENHVRGLVGVHQSIHVFTGPLYLAKLEEDDKRYVKYQVIGESEVAVPTHYFKAVFNKEGTPLEAYILPNSPASKDNLEEFRTSIEKIEKSAGFVFILN